MTEQSVHLRTNAGDPIVESSSADTWGRALSTGEPSTTPCVRSDPGTVQYRDVMVQQPDDPLSDGETAEETASRLAAYDLDGDGEVGVVEGLRAELGIIDARLEEVAHEGGVKGKIADAVHHVVDRLDND